MSDISILPPPGFEPDNLNLYFQVLSPPFEWIARRGQGWIIVTADLTFADKTTRELKVIIGKYPTYPGYLVDLRLQSDLLVELGIVDGKPPSVGRFTTFPPVIGGNI